MDSPPEYDVGSTFTVLSNPPKSTSCMKVDIDQPKEKIFNRGDAITGRVHFTPAQDTEFDRLLIDLQTTETIVKGEVYGDSATIKSNSIARHKVQDDAYPQGKVFKKGLKYSFTFSLVVPHKLQEESCSTKLPLHYQLPPSVGCPLESMNGDVSSYTADVADRSFTFSYRIRARVTKPIHKGKVPVIAQQVHYVTVIPSYPAVQLEPKTFTKQSQLKQGLLKRVTKGELEIKTYNSQVPTFFINNDDNKPQKVKFAFDVTYRAPQHEFKPPTMKQLVYKLNAITTSSPKPVPYYPDPSDSAVHCARDSFETQVAVVNTPHWQLMPGTGPRLECVATVEVMLELPRDSRRMVVPTFFSCLCSRQYEIAFMLELNGGLSPVCFNLAAVVARHKTHKLLGLLAHYEDQDLEDCDPVPTYECYGRSEYIKLEKGDGPLVKPSPPPAQALQQPRQAQPQQQSRVKMTVA